MSAAAAAGNQTSREVLTVDEGVVLRVLHALLGAERALPRAGVSMSRVRPRFAEVVRGRLAVATTRYLLDEGGRWERTVLREGKRATGRLWDRALNDGFELAFTSASLQLLLEAARTLPTLNVRATGDQATREEYARAEKRLARDVVAIDGTRVGDWVFYAMVHQRLGALGVPEVPRRALARRLRQGSPLATLLGPDDDTDAVGKRLRPLLAPGAVRALECTENVLARAWAEYADDAWEDRSRKASAVTARWASFGKLLRAYVAAVDAARRMDLTRPVMRFTARLVGRTFARGGAEVRRLASTWYDLRDIRERDELIEAVAGVVAVGADLFRRRDELATQRYGDERYEESQLYLRMVSEELTPARRALDDVARGLSGSVG